MTVLRRVIRFVAFTLVPLALGIAFAVGIVVFGAQVVQGASRYNAERSLIESRRDFYIQTATAHAATTTGGEAWSLDAQWVLLGDYGLSQFATNTPRPPQDAGAGFATNTPSSPSTDQPTAPAATATPPAPFLDTTPGPLPTILFLGEPSEAEIQAAPTAIPTAFPIIPRNHNLVNILLLGQDNEITGDSLARTDTMIIVSINRDTNTVSMLSLPRDLYVYMPRVGMNRLNIAFSVGENLGWNGGPFFYVRQVILYNLGINVHYYAMVDLSGFAELIDMIGGINLAVDCAIQDYRLIGAELPSGAVRATDDGLYTLPVGYYSMSGQEALWYARSRRTSDDFDRGRRQQQILRAGYRQVLESGILSDVTRLPELINEGLRVVETDMGLQEILSLVPVALSLRPDQIENFRLIRTYHTTPWQPPDGAFVQLPNPDEMYALLADFYTPPSPNQLSLREATVRVVNGTMNNQWDRVAAERLGWSNVRAVAAGVHERRDHSSTVVIDYTGSDKGSILPDILSALNVRPENVRYEPDPNREFDFEVIVGSDYNSCSGFVLPVEEG